MKKVAALISSLGFLATTATAFAVSPTPVSIRINPPLQGVNPATTIGSLLSSILTIMFVLAAILVLFMLIIGAFQWITSGGDKEGIDNARKRITNALIGFAILALAFLIVQVVGQIININILDIQSLPVLGQCGPNQVFDTVSNKCVAGQPTPTPAP